MIGEIDRLVAAWASRRLLMLSLYRSVRYAKALAVYREARLAVDEIGLPPGPELGQRGEAMRR